MDPQFSKTVRGKPLKVVFSRAAADEKKKSESEEIELLRNKLAETTLLLEVLAQVNSFMSKGKNFERFFIEVEDILKEKLKFKFIHIWIRPEEHPGILRLVTPEEKDGFRTMSVERGLVGKSIREGRTICAPDVTAATEYLNIHKETKSELCVPLICDEAVIGVINIETETPNTFETHIPILEIIAENLSHSMKLAMLYQTEERFHHLIENMTEGMWVGDKEEHTLYTNPALQKMLGYSDNELRQITSFDFFDETSKGTLRRENEKRKLAISSHYEATLVSKNGERIPTLMHGAPFGDADGTLCTITDLRPLKIAEKKLAAAERFLASITQYSPEAIVGLDENDVVQSWNVGAERMFGYKKEEITGKPVTPLIPEDRKAARESEQLIMEAKTKGFVRDFETLRLHKNGKPIQVAITVSALKNEHGKVIGFSALYRDVTAQKKWERELQDRFEKMQEAYREMGKQRRHLDYLIDMINMTSAMGLTQKQIASFIVNAMVMVTKVDAATLRLLDTESGKLILTAQSGLGEEWWSKKGIPYAGSLVEAGVQHGSPLKILDVTNDTRYTSKALARKNNLRSALIIPLLAKGDVLGSLALYLSHENNLNLLDDEFITVFAKQAAIALKLAQ